MSPKFEGILTKFIVYVTQTSNDAGRFIKGWIAFIGMFHCSLIEHHITLLRMAHRSLLRLTHVSRCIKEQSEASKCVLVKYTSEASVLTVSQMSVCNIQHNPLKKHWQHEWYHENKAWCDRWNAARHKSSAGGLFCGTKHSL